MKSLILKLKKNNVGVAVERDQLKVDVPNGLMAADLLQEISDNKQALINYIQQSNQSSETVYPVGEKDYYEASISQQASLLATIFRNEDADYEYTFNITRSIVFSEVDFDILERAFQSLIDRHEILRTVLVMVDRKVKQKVILSSNFPWKIQQIDICGTPNKDQVLKEIRNELIIFDFEQGPLFDIKFIRIEEQKYFLYFTIHHSISDKWSLDIIEKELIELYKAHEEGALPALPKIDIHFKDYVHWCSRMIERDDQSSHKHFWFNKLKDLPIENVATALYGQDTVPQSVSYKEKLRNELRNVEEYKKMTSEEEEQFFGVVAMMQFRKGKRYTYSSESASIILHDLADKFKAPASIVVIALVHLLLAKITQQKDNIIALNAMLRENSNVKNVIGLMTNTVFIRSNINVKMSIQEYVERVNENLLETYNHGIYPVETLINELDTPLHAISKLFLNVVSTENDYLRSDSFLKGHEEDTHPYFDLDFGVYMYKNAVQIQCSYVSDVYTKENLTYIFKELDRLISDIGNNPQCTVQDLLVDFE